MWVGGLSLGTYCAMTSFPRDLPPSSVSPGTAMAAFAGVGCSFRPHGILPTTPPGGPEVLAGRDGRAMEALAGRDSQAQRVCRVAPGASVGHGSAGIGPGRLFGGGGGGGGCGGGGVGITGAVDHLAATALAPALSGVGVMLGGKRPVGASAAAARSPGGLHGTAGGHPYARQRSGDSAMTERLERRRLSGGWGGRGGVAVWASGCAWAGRGLAALSAWCGNFVLAVSWRSAPELCGGSPFCNVPSGDPPIPVTGRTSQLFPHSASSYLDICREGTFFVDKSDYISVLEDQNAQHIVIVRPPRTGKTLFCTTMAAYYDIASAADFSALFDGLKVGDKPTASHSSYYVLFLHLESMAPEDGASAEHINATMNAQINRACSFFHEKSGLGFTIDPERSDLTVLNLAAAVAGQGNKKLYVIVDEYDRAANSMMFSSPVAYLRGVRRQLRAKSPVTSALRGLYSTFKKIGDGSAMLGLEQFRTFTTGITPLALADASVFNVGLYVSILPEMAGAFGFLDTDVWGAIRVADKVPEDMQLGVLELLKRFYNNLRFYTAEGPTLIHPMLTMAFFNRIQSSSSFQHAILGGLTDGEDDVYFGSFLDDYNVTSSQSAVNFLVNHALVVMPFTFDDVCAESGVAAVSLFQKPFSLQDLLLPPADSVNG